MRFFSLTLALASTVAFGQNPVPPGSSESPMGEQAVTEVLAPDPISPWQGTFSEGVDQVLAQGGAEEWDAALLTCWCYARKYCYV